jgi:hypothetical protein
MSIVARIALSLHIMPCPYHVTDRLKIFEGYRVVVGSESCGGELSVLPPINDGELP